MKIILLGLSCLFLLTVPCLAGEIDKQALAAAYSFTNIIDEGHFPAGYWSSSALLRRANAEQDWLDRIDRSQDLLGKVIQRKLKASRSITSFARLPDDNYLVILFNTQTLHKAKAFETLLLHQVNGLWQVCSYSIH